MLLAGALLPPASTRHGSSLAAHPLRSAALTPSAFAQAYSNSPSACGYGLVKRQRALTGSSLAGGPRPHRVPARWRRSSRHSAPKSISSPRRAARARAHHRHLGSRRPGAACRGLVSVWTESSAGRAYRAAAARPAADLAALTVACQRRRARPHAPAPPAASRFRIPENPNKQQGRRRNHRNRLAQREPTSPLFARPSGSRLFRRSPSLSTAPIPASPPALPC